jgi:transposase-like protein
MGRSTEGDRVGNPTHVPQVQYQAEARDRARGPARRQIGEDVCRDHEIAETLYYSWRDKLIEGGKLALAGTDERQGEKELKKKIRSLERALGRKTYELEIAGELLRDGD